MHRQLSHRKINRRDHPTDSRTAADWRLRKTWVLDFLNGEYRNAEGLFLLFCFPDQKMLHRSGFAISLRPLRLCGYLDSSDAPKTSASSLRVFPPRSRRSRRFALSERQMHAEGHGFSRSRFIAPALRSLGGLCGSAVILILRMEEGTAEARRKSSS